MDRTALLAGVALFDAGRYFEAHEVWEGPWLTEPDPQVRRFLQALIQMAAGFHKLRSPTGEASASRLLGKALAKLTDLPDELLGIDVAGLRQAAREWEASLGGDGKPAPRLGDLVRAAPLRGYTPNVAVDPEPALRTDPSLEPVLSELRAREPLFHRPEWGTTRADFERMITGDYWEVGASGTRFSRAFVLDVLEQRWAQPHDDPWETADFHCRDLGGGVYALTYTLIQGTRVTRRLTLWQRDGEQWRAVFHQGTLVAST